MNIRVRLTPTAIAFVGLLGLLPAAGVADVGERSRVVEINGRVVARDTGDPIPYANVGLPATAVGTVADEAGTFRLAVPRMHSPLVVSAIGYETLQFRLEKFAAGQELELTPSRHRVHERVTVTAPAPGEPVVLGHRYEERGYGFGFGSAMLGAELAARIRIKRPTFIESANFIVAHTGGERFLYRVNLYDFSDGVIGKNLLTENVIVEAKQERGTLRVDLRDRGLVVDHDVLLGLEWIRGDAELGNARVMFRARPRSRSNLYARLTSQMPLRKIDRHRLGFYLLGQPIE